MSAQGPSGTETVLGPRTIAELHHALTRQAVVVGGAAGLMSLAMPARWGDLCADLSAMGLDRIADDRVGAMTSLERLEQYDDAPHRRGLRGHIAVAQALRTTATPAVRRLITVGGVLGSRNPRADLTSALAVHKAQARVLRAAHPEPAWMGVLDVWDLHEPFAVLEVTLGRPGPSRYRRFAPHQGVAPALVSAAVLRLPGGAYRVCVGAGQDRPLITTTDALPTITDLSEDHRASAAYRHHLLHVLVEEMTTELADEPLDERDGEDNT